MNIMAKKKRNNLIFFLIVIILSVAIGITFFFGRGKESNDKNSKEMDYHSMKFKGTTYEFDSSIVSILFMGVDSIDSESVGQADSLQLYLLNRKNQSIQVVALSRDIMTDIHMYDVQHNDLGWDKQHLGLAYAYGSSKKNGAMLTTQAVSKLLFDVPINHFVAMDLTKLPEVHDIVGTLDVIVPNDSLVDEFPEWNKGNTIILTRDNVEKFVRTRDIEKNYSNVERMERQKVYLNAFFAKVNEMLTQDFDGTVSKLYSVSKDLITNISLEDIQSFAKMLQTYSYDQNTDFYTLKGIDKTGANHDEFDVDEKALKEMVVSLFYRKES